MRRTSGRPIPLMHATGKTLRLNGPVLLSIHAHLCRAASPNARESTSKCIAHYKATLIKSLLLVISAAFNRRMSDQTRSEEHTSELQSLMRISYAVFCLKKKQQN